MEIKGMGEHRNNEPCFTVAYRLHRKEMEETEFSSFNGKILTMTKIIWKGVQLSYKAALLKHFQSYFQL